MASNNKNISRHHQREQITKIEQRISAGPLPQPCDLEYYEHIVNGAAERIIKMAENQQEHRIRMETSVIRTSNNARLLGIIFAFILGFSCLTLSAYAIYMDKMGYAFTVTIGSMVSLAIAFVKGKLKKTDSK
ncbi:MAG: DUF2335 domain-containing protein [Mucispirillum sp.]|nr:DUF2335 domain-containing protein [Mucispirillum sp.]